MAADSRETGLLESVVKTMDLVVLSRLPGGAFQVAGSAPDWFAKAFGSAATLCEQSPFLDDFVHGEAEESWSGNQPRVDSGLWEENPHDGEPRFFEAVATKEGCLEVLIISRADERHRREQTYLQHVHDTALYQRKLAKESERKEILLDCIVHELSGPLSTILMNIQLVESQLDSEVLRGALQRAEQQAQRQRELIHAIAHLFDSELSHFEPTLLARGKGVEVTGLTGEALDAVRPLAAGKSIQLAHKPGPRGLFFAIANQSHLARVLDNLLNYGIYRSSEGGRISLEVEGRGERVRIKIADTAPPIAATGETLFAHPFKGRPVNEPGTGAQFAIALHFCRMAVELWGGTIGHDLPAEGGNCFWLELKKHTEWEGFAPATSPRTAP